MWGWVGLYGRPRGGDGQAVHRRSTCPGDPHLPYNFVSSVIQKVVEPYRVPIAQNGSLRVQYMHLDVNIQWKCRGYCILQGSVMPLHTLPPRVARIEYPNSYQQH
jgi:hypothetical protein